MTALHASPSPTLDESALTFITTFIANVATVAGNGRNRIPTMARVEALLISAIANGEDSSSAAWRALYREINELVAAPNDAAGMRRAHVYLRSFIHENADLAQG